MPDVFLGVDTSAYTTSVAGVLENGDILFNTRVLLAVRQGDRGLRQSDAVFLHIKNLCAWEPPCECRVRGVCVSVKPRMQSDSYMPVFLAGQMFARAIAMGANVKCYESTHQQAHIYAALDGNPVPEGDILALHASGGTTEILKVKMSAGIVREIELLGGAEDITAGKLIDRTGVMLGLPFPAGEHLEKIAVYSQDPKLSVTVRGLKCNFSGAEEQAKKAYERGADKERIAGAVTECIGDTFVRLLINAAENTGITTALLFGGVMQNIRIREKLESGLRAKGISTLFAKRGFSCDNAAGLALQCKNLVNMEER